MSTALKLDGFPSGRRLQNLSLVHCNVEMIPTELSTMTALTELCVDSKFFDNLGQVMRSDPAGTTHKTCAVTVQLGRLMRNDMRQVTPRHAHFLQLWLTSPAIRSVDKQGHICLEVSPGALDALSSLRLLRVRLRDAACLASPTLRSLGLAYDAAQDDPLAPLGLLPSLAKLDISWSPARRAVPSSWPAGAQAPRLGALCSNLKVGRMRAATRLRMQSCAMEPRVVAAHHAASMQLDVNLRPRLTM